MERTNGLAQTTGKVERAGSIEEKHETDKVRTDEKLAHRDARGVWGGEAVTAGCRSLRKAEVVAPVLAQTGGKCRHWTETTTDSSTWCRTAPTVMPRFSAAKKKQIFIAVNIIKKPLGCKRRQRCRPLYGIHRFPGHDHSKNEVMEASLKHSDEVIEKYKRSRHMQHAMRFQATPLWVFQGIIEPPAVLTRNEKDLHAVVWNEDTRKAILYWTHAQSPRTPRNACILSQTTTLRTHSRSSIDQLYEELRPAICRFVT